MTLVLLNQSLASCITALCSVFYLLASKRLDDIAGRAGRGEKQNAPEVLILLFLRQLSNGIERHVDGGKRNRTVGSCLEVLQKWSCCVERQTDAKFDLVITEDFLVPVGEDL